MKITLKDKKMNIGSWDIDDIDDFEPIFKNLRKKYKGD